MGNSASTEQMTTNQLDRHERTPRDAASDMASAHHSLDVDHFSINDPATPSSQSAMSSPASPASASAGVGGTSSSPVVVTAAPASLHPSGWTSSTSNNTGSSSPRPVPGRTGWVSSTGASSPWFSGSYSSSTSSSHQHGPPSMSQPSQAAQPSAAAAATAAQGPSAASTGAPHPTTRPHRPSISGPYYRARGHSVNQQQEPTEEDVLAYTHATFAPQPPSPSTSSTAHPPRLHLQQMTISTPSPAATNSPTTAKADTSTSSHGSAVPESTTSTPAISQTPAPNTTTPSTTSNVPTIITWSQGGKNVSVTGTFNGWKHKIKLVKSSHDFSTVLDLPYGTHELKFIVDDEWKCSNDMETTTDLNGNLVNYLEVMDEDDMEEELDDDQPLGMSRHNSMSDDVFGTEIPREMHTYAMLMQGQDGAMDPAQRQAAIDWERKLPQPPTLPPHLDKVMMNSQIVSEEDNSVLPVPNHVTLNHLYACSIKDQVMALATTTRYRKKYVTTMYYRPVQ